MDCSPLHHSCELARVDTLKTVKQIETRLCPASGVRLSGSYLKVDQQTLCPFCHILNLYKRLCGGGELLDKTLKQTKKVFLAKEKTFYFISKNKTTNKKNPKILKLS